jgi:hypothetical protein
VNGIRKPISFRGGGACGCTLPLRGRGQGGRERSFSIFAAGLNYAFKKCLRLEAIAARCDGPNQFENFDRAFRRSLTLSKDVVVKEEARLKRLRAKRRAKKPHG